MKTHIDSTNFIFYGQRSVQPIATLNESTVLQKSFSRAKKHFEVLERGKERLSDRLLNQNEYLIVWLIAPHA